MCALRAILSNCSLIISAQSPSVQICQNVVNISGPHTCQYDSCAPQVDPQLRLKGRKD